MTKERKSTKAKGMPIERILTARRRLPFYDALTFPLGKGKIVVQVELKKELGRGRAPRHERLVFRSKFGERILTGPGDIITLAEWLGVDLEKQIKKKPLEFVEIYTSCISGSRTRILSDWMLTDYRAKSPALSDARGPYVENNKLHYLLWVTDDDHKGYAFYQTELDIRTFLLNTKEIWHKRDEDEPAPTK
jgi:hypothetical protein